MVLHTQAFAHDARHSNDKAETYRVGAIEIEAPWTRATPGGAKVAGGYLMITNKGSAPDRLIGGSATVAGRLEVHEMSVVDGVMRMRPLKDGLEIAPGATVELKPGGYHIMMLDLKQGLTEGETVKGTLVFERAGTIEIEYRIGPIGASSAGEHGGHGDEHGENGHAPQHQRGHGD